MDKNVKLRYDKKTYLSIFNQKYVNTKYLRFSKAFRRSKIRDVQAIT